MTVNLFDKDEQVLIWCELEFEWKRSDIYLTELFGSGYSWDHHSDRWNVSAFF